MYNFDPSIFISIHAPPRGATVRPCANGNVLGFQFTPLREGRHKAFVDKFKPKLFQFTPLREGRRNVKVGATRSGKFQFTPLREGRPMSSAYSTSGCFISIHAPPRGATMLLNWLQKPVVQFQFTPLREGRLSGALFFVPPSYFNSRPSARGDTMGFALLPLVCGNFNSRPSARGDGKRYAISANLLFNPYKSAWLNNSATQFVEIILVIFHRIIA